MQFSLLREVAKPIKSVAFQSVNQEIPKTERYKITGLIGIWEIDEKFQSFGEALLDDAVQHVVTTEIKSLFTQTQCPQRIYKKDDNTFVVLKQVSQLAEPSPSQQKAFDKLNQWLLGFKHTTNSENSDASVSLQHEIELSMEDLYESDDEILPEITKLYGMSDQNADNDRVQFELTQMLCLFLILPTTIRTKFMSSLDEEAIWQAVVLSEPNAFQEYVSKHSQKEHEEIMTKLLSTTQLLKAYFEYNTHLLKKNMLDAIELLKFECEVVNVINKINASMLAEYQPKSKVWATFVLEQLRCTPIISIEEALLKLNSIWQGLEIVENALTKIHSLIEKMSWQTRAYYKNVLVECFRDDEYLARLYNATFVEDYPYDLPTASMLMFHQNELSQKLDVILVALQDAYDEATLADRIRRSLNILRVKAPNLAGYFCKLWLPENADSITLAKKRVAYKILCMLSPCCDDISILQDNDTQAAMHNQLLDAKAVTLGDVSDNMVKDKMLAVAKVLLSEQEKRCELEHRNRGELAIQQQNMMQVQMKATNLCSQLHELLLDWDEQFGCVSDHQLLGQLVFELNSINVSEHTEQLFQKTKVRLEQLNNLIELKNLITKLQEQNVFKKLTSNQIRYLAVSEQLLHQVPINVRDIVTCKLKLSEIFAFSNSASVVCVDSKRSLGSRSTHSSSRFLRKTFYSSFTSGSPTLFKDVAQSKQQLRAENEEDGRLDIPFRHEPHQKQLRVF